MTRPALTTFLSGHTIVVMPKIPRARRDAVRPSAKAADRRLPASTFKATCLELMDRVRETGVEFVVTKHGRPVAKLVPYRDEAATSFFGSMKGTVVKYDRPFDPIDGDYDVNRG